MTIGSVQGLLSSPLAAPHAGAGETNGGGRAGQSQQTWPPDSKQPIPQSAGDDPHAKADSQLQQLKTLASQARLELRLDQVPKSDVVVIRFVNPETGEVVREFPPEQLVKALTELRARAATHLDLKA